jgi:hypothetical protein
MELLHSVLRRNWQVAVIALRAKLVRNNPEGASDASAPPRSIRHSRAQRNGDGMGWGRMGPFRQPPRDLVSRAIVEVGNQAGALY